MIPEFLPTVKEFLKSFSTEIILLGSLFFLRLVGIDLYTKIIWLFHLILCTINRMLGFKIVLVYTDSDDNFVTTQKFAKHLEKSLKAEKFRAIPLKESESYLTWPLNKYFIAGVILFSTDVTSLSSNKKRRETIQKRISNYAHNGGLVILGHDTLYRRSKNEIFQKLAGCTLTKFSGVEQVVYVKNVGINPERISSDSILLESLISKTTLPDREYVTGSWMYDVEFLYVLENNNEIPLVTRRVVGSGKVFWMNVGDHTELGPPKNLSKPEKDFVSILSVLIKTK